MMPVCKEMMWVWMVHAMKYLCNTAREFYIHGCLKLSFVSYGLLSMFHTSITLSPEEYFFTSFIRFRQPAISSFKEQLYSCLIKYI